MSRVTIVRSLLVVSGLSAIVAGCASHASLSDRDCMTRVMYFESNRSSEDGMVAVGTTVMNRLANPAYPKTVCGVIGQRNQYAPGVLDNAMNAREAAGIAKVAERVLAGERHPQVGGAMFFHTAGLTFPYRNMHYVAVAGGNAFYEKTDMRTAMTTPSGFGTPMSSMVGPAPVTSSPPIRVARASVLFPSHRPTTLAALIAESLGFAPTSGRRRVADR